MWVPNLGPASICHGCLGINVSSGGAAPLIWTPSSSISRVKDEIRFNFQLQHRPVMKQHYLYANNCKQNMTQNALFFTVKVKWKVSLNDSYEPSLSIRIIPGQSELSVHFWQAGTVSRAAADMLRSKLLLGPLWRIKRHRPCHTHRKLSELTVTIRHLIIKMF